MTKNKHLTSLKTCYMQEVGIKLANCNRNVATWPFSYQKMCKHYGAFKVQNNIQLLTNEALDMI